MFFIAWHTFFCIDHFQNGYFTKSSSDFQISSTLESQLERKYDIVLAWQKWISLKNRYVDLPSPTCSEVKVSVPVQQRGTVNVTVNFGAQYQRAKRIPLKPNNGSRKKPAPKKNTVGSKAFIWLVGTCPCYFFPFATSKDKKQISRNMRIFAFFHEVKNEKQIKNYLFAYQSKGSEKICLFFCARSKNAKGVCVVLCHLLKRKKWKAIFTLLHGFCSFVWIKKQKAFCNPKHLYFGKERVDSW